VGYLFLLRLLSVGFTAGTLGSMLGIGGGVFVVPLLSLLLGVPIHTAIGTSIVAVVATSVGGASVYVKKGLVNVRLGIILAIATTIGGITGGMLAVNLRPQPLYAIFGIVLLYTCYWMTRRSPSEDSPLQLSDNPNSSLAATYYDESLETSVQYQVKSLPLGMLMAILAGNTSGLLGIGGGAVNVPIMHLVMTIPMKSAVATSNFLIGITGVASAFIYYARGYVKPLFAAPTVIGVLLGAQLGSRLAQRTKGTALKQIFTIVLFFTAVQMILKAFNISLIP